jgi:multidrug resistance efflux pump
MKNNLRVFTTLCLLIIFSACTSLTINSNNTGDIYASGIITANEFMIASEIGGRISDVFVQEGQTIKESQPLFKLDDQLLQAQYDQAEAGLKTTEASLEASQLQYELTLINFHSSDKPNRNSAWKAPKLSSEFEQPVWYFGKEEYITAAEKNLSSSQKELEVSKNNLEKTLENVANGEFIDAEERLADAQTAFYIADQVFDLAKSASENDELESFAETKYDSAKAELDAAQTSYDQLLSTQEAKDVLEARVKLQVAQAQYDQTLDWLNVQRTGVHSLEVKVAEALVKQAEAGVNQAKQVLKSLEIQLEKVTVISQNQGVVMNLNIDVGEVITQGVTVITIGQLDEVNLIVYIPEDQYGKVNIGDQVQIKVDSFPDETFEGVVVHIADEAEFTPRNVQTVEGRRSTVYAIKISITNLELKLKPGMPADVVFKK